MSLWGGRFSEPSDEDLRLLNDSIRFDRALYAEDIEGSMVYARALAEAGVISAVEAETIVEGLRRVMQEFDSDRFELAAGDEDIHSAVERRLIEIVGDVGGKLHTGRSRNDQVATDFRLWTMRAADRLDEALRMLQAAIVSVGGRAQQNRDARLHAHAASPADHRRSLADEFLLDAGARPGPVAGF